MAFKISNKAGLRYALAWISVVFCFSIVWHMSSSAITSFFEDDNENVAFESNDSGSSNSVEFTEDAEQTEISDTPVDDTSTNQIQNSLNANSAAPSTASPQSNPYIKLMEMQRKSLEQRKASLAENEAEEEDEEDEEEEFDEELDEEDEESFSKDRVLKRNAYFATLSNQLKELQGKNKKRRRSRDDEEEDEEEVFEEDLDEEDEEFEDEFEEDEEFEDDPDNDDRGSRQTTY